MSELYTKVQSCLDGSSNQTPVICTFQSSGKKTHKSEYNHKTDWEAFRDYIEDNINLCICLKTKENIEDVAWYGIPRTFTSLGLLVRVVGLLATGLVAGLGAAGAGTFVVLVVVVVSFVVVVVVSLLVAAVLSLLVAVVLGLVESAVLGLGAVAEGAGFAATVSLGAGLVAGRGAATNLAGAALLTAGSLATGGLGAALAGNAGLGAGLVIGFGAGLVAETGVLVGDLAVSLGVVVVRLDVDVVNLESDLGVGFEVLEIGVVGVFFAELDLTASVAAPTAAAAATGAAMSVSLTAGCTAGVGGGVAANLSSSC
ncbi:unnamed protein product [Leptidea sinapis]|uniref:Uncharacterized protein n=1 Tax=Leptidea sinapis TaxID=189913 RepID=A0A5E4QX46_9NEOP|nr:unnamed protein product [Leptidea sinapis]